MDDPAVALTYCVIESRHLTLRRYYDGRDVSGLTARQELVEYRNHYNYSRRYDPLANNGDQGYFVYEDDIFNRKIFISKREVGLSQAFHEENQIQFLFHMINKSNNHEDYDRMDPARRIWWVDNVQYMTLQMLDAPGNIVLFCNNGRTRSPMYLVAYLIIVQSMPVHKAMDIVSELLRQQRGYTLDRFASLVPIVQHISLNKGEGEDTIY